MLHRLQVLSDPARRLVYDVYGREGLAAGLQVRKREAIVAWHREFPCPAYWSVALCTPCTTSTTRSFL